MRSFPFENYTVPRSLYLYRALWLTCYYLFFRFTPVFMHSWRIFLLKLFNADMSLECFVYPSAFIWAPYNLSMSDGSCLGPRVNCYNVAPVIIGTNSTVSQDVDLCTASHSYSDPSIFSSPRMSLLVSRIVIEKYCWVTSGVFVGPGVLIREGSVILARSVIKSDTQPYYIYSGNPATKTKKRTFSSHV